MRYLVQSYQLVYANGSRDTIKLPTPVLTHDREAYRRRLMEMNPGCVGVNLTCVEYIE